MSVEKSIRGPIVEAPVGFFAAPVSHPAPGAAGKTGTWRDYRPVINEEKCVKCLLCWLYCPEDTILRREDDMVYVDYEYCKGCGICASVCPVNAIEMVPERGGLE